MKIDLNDLIKVINEKNQDEVMDIHTLYEQYMQLRKTDTRENTRIYYRDCLKSILEYFDANNVKTTDQITSVVINGYVASQLDKVSTITINKRMIVLKTMLNYMSDLGFITMPDFKYKKLKETKTKIPQIEDDDLRKVLDYIYANCDEKRILYVLLPLSTGIRRNELCNIKVKNIDFIQHKILLTFTKTHTPRYIYMTEETERLIKTVISHKEDITNPYLFEGRDEPMLNNKTITSFYVFLKQRLKLKEFSPHKLRHFYATELLNNGANLNTIRELLGHTDLEMTQRYLDISEKEVQESNYKYNPINDFLKNTRH